MSLRQRTPLTSGGKNQLQGARFSINPELIAAFQNEFHTEFTVLFACRVRANVESVNRQF